METITLLGTKCTLKFGLYPNNTIAIEAFTVAEDEPWCVPTVNYESMFTGNNYAKAFTFPAVVIKNYHENEGVYDDLIDEGVITIGPYLSGSGGTVQSATLTEKWQAIAEQQLKEIE